MRQFPVYSQRDPRWSDQRLGTVDGSTIGSDGCYTTSFAMVAGYYGHLITPAALDDILTARGLYVDGNLMVDSNLQAVYPDIAYLESLDYQTVPADLDLLRHLSADLSKMTVLEIDFNHGVGALSTHFVALVGWNGHTLTIADPWYGTVDLFGVHYGDNPAQTILKFVVYRGKHR